MPHKDDEARRLYHKEYMRLKRAGGVKPSVKPEEPATQRRAAVKFLSPCSNYQILVKPYIISIINGFPVHDRGERIEFDNGEYLTDNEATLAFLRKHQGYGSEFFEDVTPSGADNVPGPPARKGE